MPKNKWKNFNITALLLLIVGAGAFIYYQKTLPTVLSETDYEGFIDPIEYISKFKELNPNFFDDKYLETVKQYITPESTPSDQITDNEQNDIKKTMYLTELRYKTMVSAIQSSLDNIVKDNAAAFSNATAGTNSLFVKVQTASLKIDQIKDKLDQFSTNTKDLSDVSKLQETYEKNKILSGEIKVLLEEVLSIFSDNVDGSSQPATSEEQQPNTTDDATSE